MDEQTNNESLELLKNNPLFNGIPVPQLEKLLAEVGLLTLEAGAVLIQEGETNKEEFYIIRSGEIEILKKTQDEDQERDVCITVLGTGETVGEVAMIDSLPRIASARAKTRVELLIIPIPKLHALASADRYYEEIHIKLKALQNQLSSTPADVKITMNLAKQLSARLQSSNNVTAESLKNELKLAKLREESGRFLITIISFMAVYTYCMSFLNSSTQLMSSTTIVSTPLILIFASAVMYLMYKSSLPMASYGFNLKNWKRTVYESVLWSIPMILFEILCKIFVNHTLHMSERVFDGYSRAFPNNSSSGYIITMIAIYILLSPIQEIVARGAIQSSLQHILVSRYRILASIVVSGLMFGMAHLHISFIAGITVFFFSLFWGWMYSKQGNLIGVSLSHIILGCFGLFVVGFF